MKESAISQTITYCRKSVNHQHLILVWNAAIIATTKNTCWLWQATHWWVQWTLKHHLSTNKSKCKSKRLSCRRQAIHLLKLSVSIWKKSNRLNGPLDATLRKVNNLLSQRKCLYRWPDACCKTWQPLKKTLTWPQQASVNKSAQFTKTKMNSAVSSTTIAPTSFRIESWKMM